MRYVAIFTGSGEGCDYTIGCNVKTKVFEAPDVESAIILCNEVWKDHGGAFGEPGVESIQLFEVNHEIPVCVDQWNDEAIEEQKRQDEESELLAAEERVAELKKRRSK